MRAEGELVKESGPSFPPMLCLPDPVRLGSNPVCHRCIVGYREDEAQSENCPGEGN